MSRIDEAFINAYADRATDTEVVDIARVPKSTPRGGPHFQVQQPAHNLRVFLHQHVDEPRNRCVEESQGPRVDSPHVLTYDDDSCDPDCHSRESHSTASHAVELPPVNPIRNEGAHAAVERRPLSSFAAPVSAPAVFHPAFEVDALRWPVITDQFCRARSELLEPIVERLACSAHEGRAMVGVAGTRPGVGTSTVAMCLARLLAASGKSVTLIDANFALGNLAPQLGLEFESGWEDALVGRLPLAECVVHAVEDCVSLVPLRGPVPASRELLAGIQPSVVAGVLRHHYDLVLFDLGAPANSEHWAAAESIVNYCRLDVGIVVAQSEEAESPAAGGVTQIAGLFGQACLGVIGNSIA